MKVLSIDSIAASRLMFTLGFLAAALVIFGPCTVLFFGRFTPHVIEGSFWGLYLSVALASAAASAQLEKKYGRFGSDREGRARFMLGCLSFALVMSAALTLFWLARAFVERYDVIIEGMRPVAIAHANCS